MGGFLSRTIIAGAPVIGGAAADAHALRDFLAGRSEGELVLHGLFDHVLDEALPPRLRAALDAFPGK